MTGADLERMRRAMADEAFDQDRAARSGTSEIASARLVTESQLRAAYMAGADQGLSDKRLRVVADGFASWLAFASADPAWNTPRRSPGDGLGPGACIAPPGDSSADGGKGIGRMSGVTWADWHDLVGSQASVNGVTLWVQKSNVVTGYKWGFYCDNGENIAAGIAASMAEAKFAATVALRAWAAEIVAGCGADAVEVRLTTA